MSSRSREKIENNQVSIALVLWLNFTVILGYLNFVFINNSVWFIYPSAFLFIWPLIELIKKRISNRNYKRNYDCNEERDYDE